MSNDFRDNWSKNIDEVIRSRHYTWLPSGLGGLPVNEAMETLTADIMHVCKRKGISWWQVLAKAREQFEREEAECTDAFEDYAPSTETAARRG